VARNPPPRRQSSIDNDRTPWYVVAMRTAFLATLAYFLAAFAFLLLDHLSTSPHGPLWDSAFSGPFLFVMMIVVVGVLMVPFFQKEWDPGLRTFCLFAAIFLVAFAIFRDESNRFFDAQIPLHVVEDHVFNPLHRLVGF
jgi:hypothetical protein